MGLGMDKKELAYEAVVVGEQLGPVEYHPTTESVQRFVDAVDDCCPWYTKESPFGAPIVPPTLVCGEYVRLIMSRYSSEGPGWLHAKQESQFTGPAMLGERMKVTGSVADKYVRRGREYIVLESVCVDEGGRQISHHRSTLVGVGRRKQESDNKRDTATVKAQLGHEVSPVSKRVTFERVRSLYGESDKNIHTDEGAASEAGLPSPIAPGLMLYAFMSEMLANFFGPDWIRGGTMAVSFIGLVLIGDTITAKGIVSRSVVEDSGIRVTLEVWCENQEGTKVVVGTAGGVWTAGPRAWMKWV